MLSDVNEVTIISYVLNADRTIVDVKPISYIQPNNKTLNS